MNRAMVALSAASHTLRMLRTPGQARHWPAWWQSLRTPDYLLATPMPWLTFDAIAFIGAGLPANAAVFEYGSGGSTLYWLSRGWSCVSVEHDAAWFTKMQPYLPASADLDYRLVAPEAGALCQPSDPANPACYASRLLPHHNFQRYASQIDGFADASFDLVVVDGRARPSCVMHSARKVRRGGLLVLDNADNPTYGSAARAYLSSFERHVFRGVVPMILTFNQTDVYVQL